MAHSLSRSLFVVPAAAVVVALKKLCLTFLCIGFILEWLSTFSRDKKYRYFSVSKYFTFESDGFVLDTFYFILF